MWFSHPARARSHRAIWGFNENLGLERRQHVGGEQRKHCKKRYFISIQFLTIKIVHTGPLGLLGGEKNKKSVCIDQMSISSSKTSGLCSWKLVFSCVFFLIFWLINSSLTPHIYLLTLRKGRTPRVRSTGLNKQYSSSTFSCNCKLLEHFLQRSEMFRRTRHSSTFRLQPSWRIAIYLNM